MTSIAGPVQATEGIGDATAENAAARSSELCLREAFTRNSVALYRFILTRVGGDREIADELLQECCFQAARSHRPPTDPQRIGGWFCGIARNLIRRHWRASRRSRRNLSASETDIFALIASRMTSEPLPAEVLQKRETVRGLVAALYELRADDRELVFAFYFDDRPVSDIAAERRTTAKAVEARLRRARERLRAILAPASKTGVL